MAKSKIWIFLLVIIIVNVWYASNKPEIDFNFFLDRFNFDSYFKSEESKLPLKNINSSKNETFDSMTEWKNVDTASLKKDFHTFLNRFSSDTIFQLNSLKFPFKYIAFQGASPNRIEIFDTMKDWKEWDQSENFIFNTYNYLGKNLRKEFIAKDSVNVTFRVYIDELQDGEYKNLLVKKSSVSEKSIIYMENKIVYKFKKVNKKWTLLEIEEAYQEVDDFEGNVKK